MVTYPQNKSIFSPERIKSKHIPSTIKALTHSRKQKHKELNYNKPYWSRSSAILKCSNLHSDYKHEIGDLHHTRDRDR